MRLASFLLILVLSATCPPLASALPGNPPSYSISPTLNGLNVTYFAKRDVFKITLYTINHEKFPIICDVQYSSGSDRQNTSEQNLEPEKGAAFRFTYGKNSSTVLLQLICAKPGSPEHLHETE